MRKWLLLILSLSLSANIVAAADEDAKDWPQWRGPNRDAVSLEKNLLKEWPEKGPPLVWDSSVVNPGKDDRLGISWSTVSIANDKLCTVGSKDGSCFVFCLDERTGKLIWSTKLGKGGRPNSTPTIDGDRLYTLTHEGDGADSFFESEGLLACLDVANGAIIWKKQIRKDFKGRSSGWGFSEGPLVDGNKLVFTPGGDEAAMVALNKRNGEVIWKSAIPGCGGCGHASIVIAEVGGIRQYITLVGSKQLGMIGVNAANGKFLWNYKGVAAVEGHGCIPTPIVQGDLVFCSGAYQGGASLVRLVPDGDGGIKANEVFHLKGNELQVMHGGMVLVDGHIYGGHGHNGGSPFCLDIKTGKLDWKERGAGFGSAGVVYADGDLYFRYEDNVLALVEATPKGYHLRSKFQIGTGNPTYRERNSATNRELPGDLDTGWPHPVVVHGRLYIRAKNKVLCYDIRTAGVTNALSSHAALPPNYQGMSFNEAAYRAEQQVNAGAATGSRHGFIPALGVWDSKTPLHGAGWVGKTELTASIGLESADGEGRQLIHYRKTGNGHSSIFGWSWATPQEPAVDLQSFDAISFAIKITGPQKMQELFFGVTEHNPTPVSLRKYDAEFADGLWHTITIPLQDMKWNAHAPISDRTEVRGFIFTTYLWQKSDYEIYLDHFSLDRSSTPLGTAAKPMPPAVAKDPAARGQEIPGRVECAFFDAGGEGVAYHDTDEINVLSGVLNQQKNHQRPHATPYHWNFRKDEGVDLSYTKDFADFNHNQNRVIPPTNQFYIGSASDGEWCNYTVDVKKAGTYKITALYGNDTNQFQFSINNKPACECRFPVPTGSMHQWNKAQVGTITFPEAGRQLLTLHYNQGNNFAYFEFEAVDPSAAESPLSRDWPQWRGPDRGTGRVGIRTSWPLKS